MKVTKSLKSFKELIVWQKAYRLVLEIYKATKDFPKSETYSLAQQMRKAAILIIYRFGLYKTKWNYRSLIERGWWYVLPHDTSKALEYMADLN